MPESPKEAKVNYDGMTQLAKEPRGPLSFVESTQHLSPGVYNLDGFRQSWRYFDDGPDGQDNVLCSRDPNFQISRTLNRHLAFDPEEV